MFPFARFPGVDVLLGPEMKSTGEVMGIDSDFAPRLRQERNSAPAVRLPIEGTVFLSVQRRRQAAAGRPSRGA